MSPGLRFELLVNCIPFEGIVPCRDQITFKIYLIPGNNRGFHIWKYAVQKLTGILLPLASCCTVQPLCMPP